MKPRGRRAADAKEALKNYPRIFEPVYSKSISDPSWFRAVESLKRNVGDKERKEILDYLTRAAEDSTEKIWELAVKDAWVENKLSSAKCNLISRETLYATIENNSPFSFRAVHSTFLPIMALAKGAPKIIDNFFSNNPFEDLVPFTFPFRRLSPFFLIPIYRMDARKINFLLSYADQRNFTFAKFLDFVANFVLCYNSERTKDVYEMVGYSVHGLFVVREVKK